VTESLAGEETAVGALVGELAAILSSGGIEAAAQEARDIIAALRNAPRHWASVNAHAVVTASDRASAREAATRRAAGMPFAYAVGTAAFRSLTLKVDSRVLVPRPETELLVDIALELTSAKPGGTAIDIGTGSGAIALALASEGRFDTVLAGDVSADALAVARTNAERLGLAVDMRSGAFFAPFEAVRARLVVSNPPYIADGEAAALPADVRDWEPAVALFGGPDGMVAIRRIIREAVAVLEPGGWILLEVDARRASWVVEEFAKYDSYADISVRLDLTGRERFVLARLRETR
jgi:release factor glutamine methyltransferase